MDTVIIGSGIIGLSTAFYLSESTGTPPENIHLVDSAEELFECASGYAAGFLAADWFSPDVEPLGRLSFKLHKELARKYDGRKNWGYLPSTGTSYTQSRSSKPRNSRSIDWCMDGSSRANAAIQIVHESSTEDDGPAWLARYEGDDLEIMSKGDTTAQVEPRRLCQWLLDKCVERGVGVHQPARVVGLSTDVRDELASVRVVSLRDEVEFEISCTKLVITAGPWTPRVFSTLFPSARTTIRITSLAGHSVVLKSPRWNTEHSNADLAASHAVFTTDPSGFNPEFFSRTGGEIWFGGLNSSTLPLPPDAGKAKPDPKDIKRMMKIAKRLLGLPEMEDLEIVSEGLCFRPVARSGNPIISRIADKQLGPEIKTRRGGDGGVFASVGHGPWGIALSLGTGRVLADLIEGVEPSCDIRGLQI